MEREQWQILLAAVKQAARQVEREQRPERLQFGDWLVVAMYLWAVAHDRPQSWACERRHYTGVFRPRRLPSVSQFNRRMNHPRTREVLLRVHEQLGGPVTATALTYLDGKPLAVGVASKDPDARRGHVMGGFAKGYKLHAWMTEDRRFPLWAVMPLNAHEIPVAQALVAQTTRLSDRSLVLADQNYDGRDLHQAIAGRGGRLVLNPRDGGSRARRIRGSRANPPADAAALTAASMHPVSLRQMGPARRELLEVKTARPDLVRMAMRHRINAEGILGNLCAYGGGLTGLPPWARRLHRVRRWVGGKIILYHARLRARTAEKRTT